MNFMIPCKDAKSRARAITTRGITYGTSPETSSAIGVTATLSGLATLMPPAPAKAPWRSTAVRSIGWKRISIGSNAKAASTLKKSCTMEAANARSNSAGRVTCPIDTIVLVVVVPMLAPMITGTASCTVRMSDATSPTTIVVVVEELWIRLVARKPISRPASGSAVVFRSCSASPRPPILNAVLISSMLEKNR